MIQKWYIRQGTCTEIGAEKQERVKEVKTYSLASNNDEERDHGQHERWVHAEFEGADPDKAGSGRGLNAGGVKVARGSRDDAAHEQAEDDARGLHNGRAEPLTQNDCDEDGET